MLVLVTPADYDLGTLGTKVHPFAGFHGNKKRWARRWSGNKKESVSLPEKDISIISVTQDSLTSCQTAPILSSDFIMASTSPTQDPAREAEAKGVMEFQEGRDISIDMADAAAAYDAPQSNGHQSSHDLERPYMQYAVSAPIHKIEHPADRSVMLSFIGSLIYLVIALIVFVPVTCLLLVVFPIGWLVRHLMACCCCCAPHRACSCCCSRMLSPTDEMWLHDDNLNRMVLQSLITLQHGLSLMRIRDLINARLLSAQEKNGRKTYPRFTQKIVPIQSGYAWQDEEDFQVDKHIYAMPEHIRTEADLQRHVALLATQRIPTDRPLWEIQVLTDFGEAQDTVVLVRNHPTLTDGVSLVQILLRSVVDNPAIYQLKQRYGRTVFLFNAIRAFVMGPMVFFHKWIFTRHNYSILHGPKMSGKKVVSWSKPFSYAAADRIKKVTRTTMNDVLMSVVAGNLRTYFQVHGVTNPYNVTATIPVDFRTEQLKVELGTHMCFSNVILPTNVEGAIPRLWQMKQEMDDAKNSADTVAMFGSQWVLSNVLPEGLGHAIWWSVWSKATALCANIPGPDSVLLFGSREIKSVLYLMPAPCNNSLAVSFMTYADHIRMTVIADEGVLPNPSLITEDFIRQMESLSILLANRRIPGESRNTRIDSLVHENSLKREPSLEELQEKMSDVQQQMQELKGHLDGDKGNAEERRNLMEKVEMLKEEFRELLTELRRKRMSQGGTVLSDDEDEDDGELRRASYRKRTLSMTSRRSTLSNISTARPLTTSNQPLHSPPHSSVHSPSSPSMPLPTETSHSTGLHYERPTKHLGSTDNDEGRVVIMSDHAHFSQSSE